jgi:hypothetical protein
MSAPTDQSRRVGGVLLIYHRPTVFQFIDASNVRENIDAFIRHSSYPVWGVNTDLGFPRKLERLRFDALLIHYSVFLPTQRGYLLGDRFLEYIAGSDAYKIATFQDEHHWCRKRFVFIDDYGIDCVYTMLEPPYAEQVYGERTRASKIISALPGYVGPEIMRDARRFAKPQEKRTIDIGYRGRPMPPYMGRGAQEKYEIGRRFAELGADNGLRLDIGLEEEDRLYGQQWPRFLGECVGTLGVESGVSCFDLEDEVRLEYERLISAGEEAGIERLERGALGRWDWNIPYRTVSPRHFEAAAFEVCQVQFEGRYSGLMEPMRHYIPLRKDFSNLDEAIERFKDASLRRDLVANARRDLIDSGAHTYERFIRESFDPVLDEAGVAADRSPATSLTVRRAIRWPLHMRLGWRARRRINWLYIEHPRTFKVLWAPLWLLSRPVMAPYRWVQRRRLAG